MPIINQVTKGGGTTPTGTKSITANGTYDVTDFASADVEVPTTAPESYRVLEVGANGVLTNSKTTSWIPLPAGAKDVDSFVFANAYYGVPFQYISGVLDLSGLTKVSGTSCFQQSFRSCSGLTGVDLSNVKTISGVSAFSNAFSGNNAFVIADFSSTTLVSGSNAFNNAFYGDTALTTIKFDSLEQVSGQSAFASAFYGCTALQEVSFPSLLSVTGSNAFQQAFRGSSSLTDADFRSLTVVTNGLTGVFYGCSNLTNVNMSTLCKISASSLQTMFENCTSLSSLSFPNLPYSSANFNTAFANTLRGVTGCTVHFPSDWQTTMSSWSNITNGMGGTNTTILFDLPAVTTLNLSKIKKISMDYIFKDFATSNYFPNVTAVDFSGLEEVSGLTSLQSMFNGSSNITSVDLSSLARIYGDNTFYNTFKNCTGITSVNLSSLKTVSGRSVCNGMFYGCSGLTSVDLSSLETVEGGSPLQLTFFNCTGLTTLNMSGLKRITRTGTETQSLFQMCDGCTSLTNVDLSSLEEITVPYAFMYAFQHTPLTSLSFPALKTVSYDDAFDNMLNQVTGCTVHFPSNLSSHNFNVGGTNNTILFDLPATE